MNEQFFETGYELFQDRDKLNSLFLAANILDKESVLGQLKGKIDIAWTNNSLQVFDWDTQVIIIRHIMRLLKPAPHSLIVGRLIGYKKHGEHEDKFSPKGSVYRHDIKSFKKMFHAAALQLKEKWETDVEIAPLVEEIKLKNTKTKFDSDAMQITFVARKLERLDQVPKHAWDFTADTDYVVY
jgi:hypothetical protein